MITIGVSAIVGLSAGCAEDTAPTRPEGGSRGETLPPGPTLSVVAGALTACSGDGTAALSSMKELQVVVQSADGTITFDSRFGSSGSAGLTVEDVPEGPDQTVTLLGYSGGATPSWFGRQKHVLVQKGADNPVRLTVGPLGGFGCPSGDNEYTHRIFPSVTPLGQNLFFIAGGLTTVTAGGTTRFESSDSSRKAFLYNGNTGELKRVASLMATARGAHGSVLVRGSDKNKVVLFGGTNALTHNTQQANKFAWGYETGDAHSTVEVFEWEVGTDPADGQFVDFAGAVPQMFRKRVFPLVHVISTDGLVLTCGGGPWGQETKDQDYQSCDVWDSAPNEFLPDTLSNNFMAQYRAGGASSEVFQSGEVTKVLMVGGVTEGPVAEVYTSSSNQRDGVGGSFINKDLGGAPHSFFQSLTAIGDDTFVMVGGVGWNGVHFDPPSAEFAWKLRVNDDGNTVTIAAEPIGGLGTGRYFHAAMAVAGDRLSVLGGFQDNDLQSASGIRQLDLGKGFLPAPDSESAFSARGGMGFMALDNDSILIVGGINAKEDLQTDEAGAIEVYAPSNLLPL